MKLSEALQGISAQTTEIQRASRSGAQSATNLLAAYHDYQKTKSDTHAEILIVAYNRWISYLQSFARDSEA